MPKYVATLPCNLSLMACFADFNVSQGSVATYARCGGTFNIRLGTNLLRNLSARKKIVNRLRFDTIVVMSLCPRFLAHPIHLCDDRKEIDPVAGARFTKYLTTIL